MTVTDPSTAAKLGKVATIGSHQAQAWQILSCMVEEQGWHLLDIRHDRRSYWAKWTERSLRQEFGHRYHPVTELVNLHELEHDQPVERVDPAIGLAKVTTWLEAGINCLLLCRCPYWQHCHRKQVVTMLQHIYPTLEVAHLVPNPLAVELPRVLVGTVELMQRYGWFKPVPYAPGEQPVLVRTAKSQWVVLPDFGPCMMTLSVTFWLTDPLPHQEQGGAGLQLPEDEKSVDAVPPPKREERRT